MQINPNATVVLKGDEIGLVLNVLAARPWGEVNGVMTSILRQAQAGDQPAIASPEAPAEQ